jgi:ABC-type polysaccharide/polyol phosphate transport system ATPase subunit
MAFFFGAEIILYDEVLETVGPAFVQKTKHHINHSFPGDGIIVVVERSRAILEGLCNKALVIESGRILEMDDFDAVMARHGHRYTL